MASMNTTPEAAKKTEPSFDKSLYSHTDPSSLWIVVNKPVPLNPVSYAPSDLIQGYEGYVYSQRADADINAMMTAARTAGIGLSLSSAYRSYSNQTTLYANYTRQYGQATADTISARPGHSEHQTGLAFDIGGVTNPGCNFNVCFGNTVEGKWLAEHAQEYGFLIRYTEQNTAITGYSPEPWHARYVGRELAAELQKQNVTTLEEFFGVEGGATYVD